MTTVAHAFEYPPHDGRPWPARHQCMHCAGWGFWGVKVFGPRLPTRWLCTRHLIEAGYAEPIGGSAPVIHGGRDRLATSAIPG